MKKYTYKLKLKGPSTPQGTIPLRALKVFFNRLMRKCGRSRDIVTPEGIVIKNYRDGWLKEVWGKWPGDETVEELLAALKET